LCVQSIPTNDQQTWQPGVGPEKHGPTAVSPALVRKRVGLISDFAPALTGTANSLSF
jgi:hypothetical protein